ncbi:HAD family hydrolase [Aeromonas veronii]|uniref:HAD family hydrolase n=1 Tax=Aeromonas veronii TaxID=654 RepID=UPI00071892AA|nr:HAD-IA family hydrolase [Aeromonas veronii]KRV64413.1 HAD family hydrolase [Aeromonas veronii]KRV76440.1 HAD family hydrolase [Aeromonas veronii]KRV86405.1 HAD family hydrolase [Aeromonas veronii]KRV87227.1 HAD family hydrolase [Aeromonas veronii]MCF5909511.1 HAD-IA family hydrolase [Aeromonas veronii]
MQDIRLAIFDWDGTLMDSVGRIVACVQGAARDCELAVPAPAQIRQIIGLSLGVAMSRLFPLCSGSGSGATSGERQIAALIDRYRHHYLHDATPSPLFAGAGELLHDWRSRGLQLAVATGKSRRGLDGVLDETGLRPLFVTSRGADEARSKPDPLMLEQILDELGLSPRQAVMIGDSVHDMAMAEAIAMPRIGVTWGVDSRDALSRHGPVAVVDSMTALRALL